ncbi:preprotein translocase subunit SecE [Alkaliphilus crotonatoxidans]
MSTQPNTNKEKSRSAGKYFKGVRSELKKVNWPNRKELINHTSVVVVTCAMMIALLWVLDTTFGFGLNLILK